MAAARESLLHAFGVIDTGGHGIRKARQDHVFVGPGQTPQSDCWLLQALHHSRSPLRAPE